MLWLWLVACALLALFFALCFFLKQSAPKLTIAGRRVVLTGGSSGIGLATAKILAAQGANVAIIARDSTRLRKAADEISACRRIESQSVLWASCDVSNCEQITQTVQDLAKQLGGVDVLIGCAGSARPGRFMDLPLETFEATMKQNYLGNVYAARAAVPFLRRAGGGRIIFVSSMAGLSGVSGYTAYSASKFALRGLAEALHMELRPLNIHVSVAHPPDVDTPGFATENQYKPEECKLMSEGLGLFKPEAIASDIVKGIERWSFMINTGFEGHLSAHIFAGNSPASSVVSLAVEFFFLGFLRLVSLFYLWNYNRIVERVYRKEKLTSAHTHPSSGAAAPAPSPESRKDK